MSGPLGSSQWMYQSTSDYTIDQSLRFEEGRSTYLARTPSSNGNRDVWTFSTWVKITEEKSAIQPIFYVGLLHRQPL